MKARCVQVLILIEVFPVYFLICFSQQHYFKGEEMEY